MAAYPCRQDGWASARAEAVRYAAPTGQDRGDCTSSPCLTIGFPIGKSIDGDTIDVAVGTQAVPVNGWISVACVGREEHTATSALTR